MRFAAYEHRGARLAPRHVFYSRVARAVLVSVGLIALTLAVGTFGYTALTELTVLQAFHQAAMLLSGMGPVHTAELKTTGAILFESVYAIFCGVMLLAATGVMFAPLVHRLLHRFHLEGREP